MSRLPGLLSLVGLLAACGPSVTTVAVEPNKLTLIAKDQKATLTAQPKDKDGQMVVDAILKLRWTSSDPAVATVGANGVVTALKSGVTKVSAAVGEVSSTVDVVVSIPTTITFDPPKTELVGVKKSVTITPIVKDEAGREVPGVVVIWSTSDNNVASITDGLVVAEGAGTATLKATLGEASGSTTIVVTHPAVAGIALEPAAQTLEKVGDAVRLKANLTDAQGQAILGFNPKWSSSDPNIATVSDAGQVLAVKKGKAKIKAVAGDKTAEAEIIVK